MQLLAQLAFVRHLNRSLVVDDADNQNSHPAAPKFLATNRAGWLILIWFLATATAAMSAAVRTGTNLGAVAISCSSLTAVCHAGDSEARVTSSYLGTSHFNETGRAVNLSQSMTPTGRPTRIDVTKAPYNADPTGTSDSTRAIQSAITAMCRYGRGSRPALFLPFGYYKVTQTQNPTSTTAPIFDTTACGAGGIYIYSEGSSGGTGAGKAPGGGAVIQVTAGPNPNPAAVFGFVSQESVQISNIAIYGDNQGISVWNGAQIHFHNLDLTIRKTAQKDNVPLKITNSLWIWWEHGAIDSGSSTGPDILMTGEKTPVEGESVAVGLVTFEDAIFYGGGVKYIQRVRGGVPGGWSFSNIVDENNGGPFLAVTESSSGFGGGVGEVELNNVHNADPTGPDPLVELDQASGKSAFINVTNSDVASNSPTILVRSGYLLSYQINGGGYVSDVSGHDWSSGAIIGGLQRQTSAPNDVTTCDAGCSGIGSGASLPATTFWTNGTPVSQLGLSPSQGILFSDGATFGYGSSINGSVQGDVDVRTAYLLPPTKFSGAAARGGSLATGTYYGTIWSTSDGSGAHCYNYGTTYTSGFAYAEGVKVGQSEHAVNFKWTVPKAAPGVPAGYCLGVSNSNPGRGGSVSQALFVAGGRTTNFLYTGQSQKKIGNVQSAPLLVPVHRFTYNALGVNTTTPVPGTLTVNGGTTGRITTKSTSYTLAATDSTVDVTGTTTITVPHVLPKNGISSRWWVINSGAGTVTLRCDIGKINGLESITLAANASVFITADGTNCFGH